MSVVVDKEENDEPLRLLENPIFDSNTPIERINVDDSIILKLAYSKGDS